MRFETVLGITYTLIGIAVCAYAIADINTCQNQNHGQKCLWPGPAYVSTNGDNHVRIKP